MGSSQATVPLLLKVDMTNSNIMVDPLTRKGKALILPSKDMENHQLPVITKEHTTITSKAMIIINTLDHTANNKAMMTSVAIPLTLRSSIKEAMDPQDSLGMVPLPTRDHWAQKALRVHKTASVGSGKHYLVVQLVALQAIKLDMVSWVLLVEQFLLM